MSKGKEVENLNIELRHLMCQEESLGRKLDEGQVLENLDRHTREIRKV